MIVMTLLSSMPFNYGFAQDVRFNEMGLGAFKGSYYD